MTHTPLPRSTYRVQFHKGFTFRDAVAIVPYLAKLGVTHLYASPYLKAVAGSTHGYDVIDHATLNSEVGSEFDYRRLLSTLSAHGMCHILDTVPNHMGVDTNDNQRWNATLAGGPTGDHAEFFDVDWAAGDGKVLLPVLGEPYGDSLASGKITVGDGVAYYDKGFPLAGRPDGDADAVLQRQHYRLCYWRVAPDEINYRRFFDVTSLAAIRMDRQEVFDAAYDFTFRLIAEGAIAGLRIDHPDGLTDPRQFLDRLQERFKRIAPDAPDLLPVWVEKILNGDEPLPNDWPVRGTSGYDFLYAANDLLVDPAAEQAMSEIYATVVEEDAPFDEWVYRKKRTILDRALASELQSLTRRLYRLTRTSLAGRDFTLRQLASAIREVVACFPVYRTYVSPRGVGETDVAIVHQAVDKAVGRNPAVDRNVFDAVRDVVLQRGPIAATDPAAALVVAQRFQQLTSPVNAKGVEDTAFYTFNRLTSLNEVGGDPGRFGRSSDAIHQYMLDRQRHWPAALSVLSTHDTKRSEDVRARIAVLADMPDRWAQCVAKLKAILPGTLVTPNDQFLLLQTVIGAWTTPDQNFVDRIKAYMTKAIREAKVNTGWTDPNPAYESAVMSAVERLIAVFPAEFGAVQTVTADFGIVNSLSQTLIRLTAPGVPDTYQGTELWDFSLVDPDNRRPVDYAARQAMLDALHAIRPSMADLFATRADGRIKMHLTSVCLKLRNDDPDLFALGSYVPLKATGRFARQVFAFAREHAGRRVVVAIPRSPLTISVDGTVPLGDAWGDTTVDLPNARPMTSAFDRSEFTSLKLSAIWRDAPVALLRS